MPFLEERGNRNLFSRGVQNKQPLRNVAIHNTRRIQMDRDFLAAER